MNGKGDTPRPLSIPQDKFSDNWDRIFGKKEKERELLNVEVHDASKRNEDNNGEFSRVDEDGNPIEWTAC
jgi:hypothetical protein